MVTIFFKEWILAEDSKSLARGYSDLLRNVPQDSVHHPEGDALTHIKLVRKSIPQAIKALNDLKSVPPFSEILADIDFNVSPDELQILYISAWLHDIGKATATTIGGINYSFLRQMDILYQNDPSKIKSIGHDNSSHYSPLIKGLEGIAPEKTKSLYLKNKDIIDFIIDHHMDLTLSGFSRSFIKDHFYNGKVIPTKKIKLLLITIWADKMGRTPEVVKNSISKNEQNLIDSSKKSVEQKINAEKTSARSKSFADPASMAIQLSKNGLSKEQIEKAVKGKFPNISDIELFDILRRT